MGSKIMILRLSRPFASYADSGIGNQGEAKKGMVPTVRSLWSQNPTSEPHKSPTTLGQHVVYSNHCKMSASTISQWHTHSPDREIWTRSDKYHNSFLLEKDDVLDAALETSKAQGLPNWATPAAEGKLWMLLASSIGAKRILEVGTLGG